MSLSSTLCLSCRFARVPYRGLSTFMAEDKARKRVKLEHGVADASSIRAMRSTFLDSLTRSVSPPPGQTARPTSHGELVGRLSTNDVTRVLGTRMTLDTSHRSTLNEANGIVTAEQKSPSKGASPSSTKILPSPIHLSRIRDLPSSDNVDSIDLRDILGHPLIKEAWIFNFCFDVDWMMQHFDEDVRDTVKVNIVHGSWKREDVNKLGIDDACRRSANVKSIQAYLPDAYGTHHSKMFILFRHDDYAQIIIHTANMLAKDWNNMTQAIWRSPLLPLLEQNRSRQSMRTNVGNQFKHDLTRYLRTYGGKLKSAVEELQRYDFEGVRVALVASVPCHFKTSSADDQVWGHEMLSRKLQSFNPSPSTRQASHHCVYQVSSIASLPQTWLEQTLYKACGTTKDSTSIIFPTASDVAASLDGYMSGGSIHTKAQKPVHLKQISLMRPQLCRWTQGTSHASRAGRHLAAPHIKTFVRFSSKPTAISPMPDIDWALVTSANLSTQAWGSIPKTPKGEKDPQEAIVHIQSFEIGVLVWPEVFKDTNGELDQSPRMVPTFLSDTPHPSTLDHGKIVGFRMPYDLPLTPYTNSELPWSPQSTYDAPDRHGRLWQ